MRLSDLSMECSKINELGYIDNTTKYDYYGYSTKADCSSYVTYDYIRSLCELNPKKYNMSTNENGNIILKFDEDVEVNNMKKDFKIKNYKTYGNKVLVVTFEDGSQEKAVCNEDDKFELERALEVCVFKHIFGATEYKSMIKYAMKQIKAIDKAEEDEKERKELIARKRAKAAKKKAKRKAKERAERIEDMKEAFLKAINECGSDYEPECNCGTGCSCK